MLKIKKGETLFKVSFSFPVPGVGVEPTQIALLVFETSASTGSAIRARAAKIVKKVIELLSN